MDQRTFEALKIVNYPVGALGAKLNVEGPTKNFGARFKSRCSQVVSEYDLYQPVKPSHCNNEKKS